MINKKHARIRRALKTRHKLYKLGVTRLVVHRTSQHIYAQIIKSDNSEVITSASTTEQQIKKQVHYTGNKTAALLVGSLIAERALQKGIKNVAFDRSGFRYHGRIKFLADAARKAGLNF
uniref:Large ribosomal subunit protein uL18 n=1 Tax=Candidatus Aschnera chinzeii TaxID=1485666 RepID=A0AAT9G465_9ENTR|nr:MAG: 50S ribosomal protein L18 [Candidatus Aschnera chinzeii]